MQNITVEVCIKNKTVIIGKGIDSSEKVIDELEKRFSDLTQNRQLLKIEYENGGQTLQQAYDIALKQSLKFIKIKVDIANVQQGNKKSYEQLNEQKNVSSSKIQANSKPNKQVIMSQIKQVKQQSKRQKQIKQQEQKKVEQVQKLIQKSQINVEQEVEKQQIQDKKQQTKTQSQQILLINSIVNKDTNQKSEFQNAIVDQKQIIKCEELVSNHNHEQIVQTLLNQQTISNKQFIKNQNQDQAFQDFIQQACNQGKIKAPSQISYSSSKQRQIQNQLNKKEYYPYSQSFDIYKFIIDIKNQFGFKINHLQLQNKDLSSKYQQLNKKYQNLSSKHQILQKNYSKISQQYQTYLLLNSQSCHKVQKKKQSQKSLIKQHQKQGYKLIPVQDPLEKNTKILPQAQIVQLQYITEIIVGKAVTPKFRLTNIGKRRWPDKVFVWQQINDQLVQVKSLQANQSVTISLNQEIGYKVGDKINKLYQLVYLSEKGELTKFGRVFGVYIQVKNDKKNNGPKSHIDKSLEPFMEFRNYVNDLMKIQNINKSLIKVVQTLQEYGVNEHNYKTTDVGALIQIIKCI